MAAFSPRHVGLAIGLAVILGALFLLWPSVESPKHRQDAATDSVKHAPMGDTSLAWREGRTQRYRVVVNSDFTMSMPGNASQSMGLQMAGILEQETLTINSAGIMVGMRLNEFAMSIDGASDPGVNSALQIPFRVLFNPSGRPLKFEFPATLAAENRDILENLVSMFQVVLNEGEDWEINEENGSGRYKARYSRVSNAALSKQKLFYIPGPRNAAIPEVESTETIVLDPNHDWITAMEITELIITEGVGTPPTQVTNIARLELLNDPSPQLTTDWGFAASPAPEKEDPLAEALRNLSDAEALEQMTSVIVQLNEADAGREKLIYRVRDLLLANDQLPAELVEALRTEDLSVETRANLYLAFELAGTPSSQAALTTILSDANWPPEDAMRAIVALAGLSEPTPETLNSLWGLARSNLAETGRRDLPGTAALAIGSLGNQMRQAETVDYSALRSDLLASVSSAIEPTERVVYLYALANTGDPDPVLKQDIIAYLDDPSSEVRSAAAKTLARIGSNEVETQVLQRAQLEPSGPAKASMVEALTNWEEPPEEALAWTRESIGNEPDERTRYNMVVLLGNNLEADPQNRQILENLLETDPSKQVRQKAADILYQ